MWRLRSSATIARASADGSVAPTAEVADVEENGNEEVKGVERGCLDGEAACARLIAALDLHAYLRQLAWARAVARVGMNTDEVVALIARRCLVGEDVPPHEVTHDEIFRALGDDRKKVRLVRHLEVSPKRLVERGGQQGI